MWLFAQVLSAKFGEVSFDGTNEQSSNFAPCKYFSTNLWRFSPAKVSRYMIERFMCHSGTVVGVVDLQSLANYAQLLPYCAQPLLSYAMPALLVETLLLC